MPNSYQSDKTYLYISPTWDDKEHPWTLPEGEETLERLDSQRQAGQSHQSFFLSFWKAFSNDHLYSNGLRYKTYYFFDEAESANPNYLDVVQQEP